MNVTIQKWGNSMGVRIPKAVIQSARLSPGSQLEISVKNGTLVMKPVAVPALSELLAKVRPGSRPKLAGWGKPIGNEVW